MTDPELRQNAIRYLSESRPPAHLEEFLGGGTDGQVWKTSTPSAVKACWSERAYFNERDSYRRLAEFGVLDRIGDFWVSRLLGCDDHHLVVELDLMQRPPYILDFGKAQGAPAPTATEPPSGIGWRQRSPEPSPDIATTILIGPLWGAAPPLTPRGAARRPRPRGAGPRRGRRAARRCRRCRWPGAAPSARRSGCGTGRRRRRR